MAEVRISLGATADIASTTELDGAITGVKGHLDSMEKRLNGARGKPIRRKLFAESSGISVTVGGQTALSVPMDGTPSVERYWNIRSISVYDTIAPLASGYAGTQFVLCVGSSAAPSVIDFTGEIFAGLPFGTTVNETSIRVTPNQNIYLLANTGAFTNAVGFAVELDEYTDWSFNQQVI